MFVRLELNSMEKVILCAGDTNATNKLSDISFKYDVIFNEPYATATGDMYGGTNGTLIP